MQQEKTRLITSPCTKPFAVYAIAWLAILPVSSFASPEGSRASKIDSVPAISCGSDVYDFGSLDNEETIDHTFVLVNSGNATLKIDKIIACCGSKTALATRNVAPGAESTLQVRFPLKGRSGEQRMAFYVRSNDPVHPLYELKVRGKALARVEVRPTGVMFGAISGDTTCEKTVRIICVSNISFNVTNVICNTSGISASYIGISNGVYHVLVRTVPTLRPGITRAIVYVHTDHAKYGMIEIPVLARVTKDIVVFPAEISLTKVAGGQIRNSEYAVVKSLSKTPFKITGSEVPRDGIDVVWSQMANGGYKIEIRNLLPMDEMDGKQIILKTDNDKAGDVAIPIRVVTAPQD